MKLKNTSLGIFFFMFLHLVVGRNISSNSSERRSISPTYSISSYSNLSQYTNTIDARHSDTTASITSYDLKILTSSVQITPIVIPTTTQTRYYGYNSSGMDYFIILFIRNRWFMDDVIFIVFLFFSFLRAFQLALQYF